jgi:hypothetical protein
MSRSFTLLKRLHACLSDSTRDPPAHRGLHPLCRSSRCEGSDALFTEDTRFVIWRNARSNAFDGTALVRGSRFKVMPKTPGKTRGRRNRGYGVPRRRSRPCSRGRWTRIEETGNDRRLGGEPCVGGFIGSLTYFRRTAKPPETAAAARIGHPTTSGRPSGKPSLRWR